MHRLCCSEPVHQGALQTPRSRSLLAHRTFLLLCDPSVSFHPDDSTARAALVAGPRASVGAPGRPGDATPNLVQTHVMAGSAVPDAMSSTPPDAVLPPDDASEASDASVATVSSSHCDPQSPDEVPPPPPPPRSSQLRTWVLFLRLRMLLTSSLPI